MIMIDTLYQSVISPGSTRGLHQPPQRWAGKFMTEVKGQDVKANLMGVSDVDPRRVETKPNDELNGYRFFAPSALHHVQGASFVGGN